MLPCHRSSTQITMNYNLFSADSNTDNSSRVSLQADHGFFVHYLFWRIFKNKLSSRDVIIRHSVSFQSSNYEALAFLARGDILSSDFTTPLAEPPRVGSLFGGLVFGLTVFFFDA